MTVVATQAQRHYRLLNVRGSVSSTINVDYTYSEEAPLGSRS